ncbi:MAG: hypothetical protein V5A84_03925, partial [Planctomycetota bacterium]
MTTQYERAVSLLHERNIAIEGNFMFGFDRDTEEVFDATAQFSVDVGIDFPEFFLLTPYPGTRLYRELDDQGRIVDRDWSHYENVHFRHLPVFEPTHMTREQLRRGCLRADRLAYSPRNTVRRVWNSGIVRPAIMLANYVNMRRIMHRNDLLPRVLPPEEGAEPRRDGSDVVCHNPRQR